MGVTISLVTRLITTITVMVTSTPTITDTVMVMVTFMVTTTDTDMVMVMATAMVTVTTIIIAKVLRKKNEKSVRRPTKSTKRLIRKSTSNINIVTKQRVETTGRQLEPNGKKKIQNQLSKSMIT